MIVQFQVANVGQFFVRTDWVGITSAEIENLRGNGRLAEERRASIKAEIEFQANSFKYIDCAGRA